MNWIKTSKNLPKHLKTVWGKMDNYNKWRVYYNENSKKWFTQKGGYNVIIFEWCEI